MPTRHRAAPAILVIALGLLVSGPALAQLPPMDPQRLQDAIDVTDRRIQQAQELLSGAPNQAAQAEVDQAVALQALAKSAFAQSRYAAAARATFDARLHADRAVAILRGLPDPRPRPRPTGPHARDPGPRPRPALALRRRSGA